MKISNEIHRSIQNQQWLDYEKNLIKAINKSNEKIVSKKMDFDEQTRLYLLCANFIVEMQKVYMAYKSIGINKYNTEECIQMDYETSQYAFSVFNKLNKIVMLFISQRQTFAVLSNKYLLIVRKMSERMLSISARWNIEHAIEVFEIDKGSKFKAFEKRKPLLLTAIFFVSKLLASQLGIKFKDNVQPNQIIFCVMPSSGKSLVLNIYSILAMSLYKEYHNISGILRVSNNEPNACGFSANIIQMMKDVRYLDIFPEFMKYMNFNKGTNGNGKFEMFQTESVEEWKLKDLHPSIRASHFAKGRGAAINSIRVFIALEIDDLSDGEKQANNDEEHKSQFRKFSSDMEDRAEFEDMPKLIFGTMYNPFDVPNQIIQDLEDRDQIITFDSVKYTKFSKDLRTIIIQIPCFDEKGESICPDFRSTRWLKEKQSKLDDYLFSLLYLAQRATREGREFSSDKLQRYTFEEFEEMESHNLITKNSIAFCDPTRSSHNDFFSLFICRQNILNGKYYNTNNLFDKKSVKDKTFLKEVIDTLYANNVERLHIETNVDASIGDLIKKELKMIYDYDIVIVEVYQTIKKMVRILDESSRIKSDIFYKHPKDIKPKSYDEMFMENLTGWSSIVNVKNDDAPDSVAGFCSNVIERKEEKKYAQIEDISKNMIRF